MTDKSQRLLQEALQLSTGERAELAGHLVASLPDEDVTAIIDPAVLDAWKTEVRRRWEEFERGEVTASDGETVFRELYARYGS